MRGGPAQAARFGPAGEVAHLSTSSPDGRAGAAAGATPGKNRQAVDNAVENSSNLPSVQWLGHRIELPPNSGEFFWMRMALGMRGRWRLMSPINGHRVL